MLRRHYAITNSAVMSKTDRIARRRPPSDRLYVSVSFIILPDRYTASFSLRLFIQLPIYSMRVYFRAHVKVRRRQHYSYYVHN